jgi:hypothetical protein
MTAAGNGHLGAVQALLEHGADCNAADDYEKRCSSEPRAAGAKSPSTAVTPTSPSSCTPPSKRSVEPTRKPQSERRLPRGFRCSLTAPQVRTCLRRFWWLSAADARRAARTSPAEPRRACSGVAADAWSRRGRERSGARAARGREQGAGHSGPAAAGLAGNLRKLHTS